MLPFWQTHRHTSTHNPSLVIHQVGRGWLVDRPTGGCTFAIDSSGNFAAYLITYSIIFIFLLILCVGERKIDSRNKKMGSKRSGKMESFACMYPDCLKRFELKSLNITSYIRQSACSGKITEKVAARPVCTGTQQTAHSAQTPIPGEVCSAASNEHSSRLRPPCQCMKNAHSTRRISFTPISVRSCAMPPIPFVVVIVCSFEIFYLQQSFCIIYIQNGDRNNTHTQNENEKCKTRKKSYTHTAYTPMRSNEKQFHLFSPSLSLLHSLSIALFLSPSPARSLPSHIGPNGIFTIFRRRIKNALKYEFSCVARSMDGVSVNRLFFASMFVAPKCCLP